VIILGIDPGLANTGWGVIEQSGPRSRCIAYGCVTTRANEQLAQRLSAIHDGIVEVIERYAPAECAVESVFFGSNAKSAFATGQARGVALLATADSCIELAEYSPVQIKSVITGSGTADKQQIQYMVRALLNLDHEPKPDHCADALAAAICHAAMRGHAALERSGERPALEHTTRGSARESA
jgi:crossover junction endodeoxyribonuclease RuvC